MFESISHRLSAQNKLYTLFRCIAYHYGLTFLSVLLMVLIDLLIPIFFNYKPILSTRWKSSDIIASMGVLKGVALITFFGPIVEEIAFRLALTANKLSITISLSTLIFFLSGPVFYIDNTLAYSIRVISSGMIGVLFYWFIHSENTKAFFATYQNYLLVISAIFFAGIHISNFHPIQYEIIFLYPIYVLPQFFMGLILGWLRIQYGFFWAVLFHILVNGSTTWPKALSML